MVFIPFISFIYVYVLIFLYREDRHAPPNKKAKQKEEEDDEDLNDANYDEVRGIVNAENGSSVLSLKVILHPITLRFYFHFIYLQYRGDQLSPRPA